MNKQQFDPNDYIRTCQECGNQQRDKNPVRGMTDAFRNRKCLKCHSTSLDHGTYFGEDEKD